MKFEILKEFFGKMTSQMSSHVTSRDTPSQMIGMDFRFFKEIVNVT